MGGLCSKNIYDLPEGMQINSEKDIFKYFHEKGWINKGTREFTSKLTMHDVVQYRDCHIRYRHTPTNQYYVKGFVHSNNYFPLMNNARTCLFCHYRRKYL